MFWSAARRLAFLCDASDRKSTPHPPYSSALVLIHVPAGFEIMELQPPEPTLTLLESKALQVIGQSWQKKLDSVFLENLGKHRKYDSRSLKDLLRALRNKVSLWQIAVWRGLQADREGFTVRRNIITKVRTSYSVLHGFDTNTSFVAQISLITSKDA
jgi:hypothetical protein